MGAPKWHRPTLLGRQHETPFITTLLLFHLLQNFVTNADQSSSCTDDFDPALQTMPFDLISSEKESFLAYVQPDVSSFYQNQDKSMAPVKPSYLGLAGKFFNLSPEAVELYWDPGYHQDGVLMSSIGPFEAWGTATFQGHKFYLTPTNDPNQIIQKWEVTSGNCLYVYDPYSPDSTSSIKMSFQTLDEDERNLYDLQKESLYFGQQYRKFTGRDWLSLYPRSMPMHKMWKADYFGQRHWVETRETHFESLPPDSELGRITQKGTARKLSETEPRVLQSYRTTNPTLNLTLTTLSCAPLVFEIKNFLSNIEADHILELATGMNLKRSTTSGEGHGVENTRTSLNTWVPREKSPIVDSIYRRAADLLQIDEALLRSRDENEFPDLPTQKSIAEHLQLVHYDPGQEYTAHHDFSHPPVEDLAQCTRFATLLLYLNDGMEGGETSFPRWVNSETSEQLKVAPEKGKAVLFYSLLPDGNMDDLSQHAALPVTRGEKWLMNLWVWDPFMD